MSDTGYGICISFKGPWGPFKLHHVVKCNRCPWADPWITEAWFLLPALDMEEESLSSGHLPATLGCSPRSRVRFNQFPSVFLLFPSIFWLLRQTELHLAKLLQMRNTYLDVCVLFWWGILLFFFFLSIYSAQSFASHFPIRQSQGCWRDPICAFQGAKLNSSGTGGAGSRKVTPGPQQVGWVAQEISRQQAAGSLKGRKAHAACVQAANHAGVSR